jgi:hypothetical protein
MNITQLKSDCSDFVQTTNEALDWVATPQNAELLDSAAHGLTRNLRRVARRAEKLSRAVDRNASVSVFGPSQAGKSFLVSVLARPQSGPLIANYDGDGKALDFIKDINPEGQGESTALVTRFTINRTAAQNGFAVKLSMLSESDVLRVLINSFYRDGDQSEPPLSSAKITAHLDRFKPTPGLNVGGLVADDVWEVQEYVEANFARAAYAMSLNQFWDRAAQLAPDLSQKDRGALFSVLWGGHAPMTELFLLLVETLAKTGNADVIFADTDVLVPKDESIIDVKMLHQLYSAPNDHPVTVYVPGKGDVQIGKPLLSALTAEMEVPMAQLPHDVLEYTDLLDFPGARNRFERPLEESLRKPAETLSEMFLRGKVAYLFDRYVAEQEITAMLLCVPPSNMDTVDLPGLVDGWISDTMGTDAATRAAADNILFFVLTKFDNYLVDTAASGDDASRFDRGIGTSLHEKFGQRRDKWVEKWGTNAPFKNCFWLRNPNYPAETFFKYDSGREEPRADKADRLAALKSAYQSAELVQRHFKDPDAAWASAMTADDGGVAYLIEEMTKVCKRNTKPHQIQIQLNRQREKRDSSLLPYYVSDDIEAQCIKVREEMNVIIPDLEGVLDRGAFGTFLSALAVQQDRVRDAISTIPDHIRLKAGQSRSTPASTASAGRSRWGAASKAKAGLAEAAAPAPKDANRTMTRETYMATTALQVWSDSLMELRGTAPSLFGISEHAAATVIAELQKAINRLQLKDVISQRLGDVSYGLQITEQAPAAAILCAEEINRFVAQLGYDALAPAERPTLEMTDTPDLPVFAERPFHDDVNTLPDEMENTSERVWLDWVHAFADLGERNVRAADGTEIDTVQNTRLGDILGIDPTEMLT